MKRLIRTLRTAALAAFAMLLGPGLALAQEFQKVEGAPRQEVPAVPFVGYAYGFIWIALLAYVFFVARGLSRVDKELSDLQRKLGAELGTKPGATPDTKSYSR
jgi:CcmD family protein